MIIGHASDLHGKYKKFSEVAQVPDLWIISGDFFPNYGRGMKTQGLIDPAYEKHFQEKWWSYKATSIATRLCEKPVIWVAGNHDFISLVEKLKNIKYPAPVFDLSKGPADFAGQRFAGYREIPYISGEWPGEVFDFKVIVESVLKEDPTILVTHAPPGGILDQESTGERHGVSELTMALTYKQHRITHHFFGHNHNCGGKIEKVMDITFINSAKTIQLIHI